MSVQKLNISLETGVVRLLKQRAAEEGVPVSRYLGGLIVADARESRDRLAIEGYRRLSADTADFAEAALPLADESWGQHV